MAKLESDKVTIEELEEFVKLQSSKGNYNFDAYMHGMANGMIFMLATIKGEEPKYLDAPAQWSSDKKEEKRIFGGDYIHLWFELSYAQYLTIPRSVLQSMPDEWQKRFVECLEELDNTIDWRPKKGTYRVQLMTIEEKYDEEEGFTRDWGVEIDDPLQDYQRGRRRVPYINEQEK